MRILLAAATVDEIRPTLEKLGWEGDDAQQPLNTKPGLLEVCITGVGLMQSTFALTQRLMQQRYDFVLQAGVAGAFDPALTLGEVVVVTDETLGDLGAEDRDDFVDTFTLGLAHRSQFPFRAGRLENPRLNNLPFSIKGLKAVSGLTVHTVSGRQSTIELRMARHPEMGIETMEGAALHYVCRMLDVPFLEVRAISNRVEPRNRAAWKLKEAVQALNEQLLSWLTGKS